MLFRVLLILALMLPPAVSSKSRAEETLGHAIKKMFSTPTPTPHRKKKKTSSTEKKSPTPTPTVSAKKKKTSPAPEEESPSPSASPKKKKASPTPEEESPSPTASPKKKKGVSPSPEETTSPHRKKKHSPTPEPLESPEESIAPIETPPHPSETPEKSASPLKKLHAANASLMPNQIKGFEDYPLKVQKLLTSALELTTRDLDYKYGSDDPANGGMDCSGFVYYVLKQNEIADVPRDSSSQYVWLRRARQFESVLSEKDDSFELEDLKPGDLLFWTGTYAIERDPPITHAMIYLGREKKTGNRVMVGASDGRVYQGESRFGVSVFDFKVQRREKNGDGRMRPTFIGYGHIPGLQQ
jgi:peptidoglycan DL-endopeptidase CwlO